MRALGWIAVILVCLAAAAWAMRHRGARAASSSLVGQPAPGIALATVDGAEEKLADEKGKVVVADFWATWCPSCRQSLPHLQKISANAAWAKEGLVMWAIDARESPDSVAKFLKDNNYTFTALMDATGSTMAAYGVDGIPTTVIIGRDGLIKSVFVDYSGDETAEAIDNAVQNALAQGVN